MPACFITIPLNATRNFSVKWSIQTYLKTKSESGVGDIQRNTDVVQAINTSICGHLCLFVLKALAGEHWSFQQVLNTLNNGYS